MGTLEASSILIVDDATENLRVLTGFLRPLGYEVRPATNGRRALQAAEHAPPELVLLDVNMPEMTGFEVCAAFKAQPHLRDIPIIFLTASNDVTDKVKAFSLGGVDFITKPFHLEEVQARVETHIKLRRTHLELQNSYQKLRQLERLRDDLVQMFVHDMRSPLTVLMAHLSFLQDESERLSQTGTEDLQEAILGARELTHMANDLLDISRMEERKLPLRLTEQDLADLAIQVQRSLCAFQRGREIKVVSHGPLRVTCDEGLVRRVLENLVSNAIKHTPSDGVVCIQLRVEQRGARVSVCDDGPGVPLAARERIFDKFGVLAERNTNGYHSAGLGLAFCKLAVETHGGSIGVDSREPRGSEFWFELPLPT